MSAIVDDNTKSSTSSISDNHNHNHNDKLVTITNPDVEVTLPNLKYGYRTTKASWNELVQIIQIEYDIPKLSRSRIQQHDYEVFRYHMKEQYSSSLDYILISKFGFDAVVPVPVVSSHKEVDKNPNKINNKWLAKPFLENVDSSKILLIENDFPYYVEDNIVHYVLWKIKEPLTQQEILDAREELQTEKIKALDILQWVNPPNLKSIPEIDHVHFLCRLWIYSIVCR